MNEKEYKNILNNPDKLRGLRPELIKDFIEFGIKIEKDRLEAELEKKISVQDARIKELLELKQDKYRDEYNWTVGVANGLRRAVSVIHGD